MGSALWLIWAWMAGASAAEPCTASTADLQARLEEAESLYQNLDIDGFKVATDEAARLLPCLTDPMPRRLAASYHRFRGLRAFVDGDPVMSTSSFAAARAIEPAYRFPEVLVPKGNPVLQEYEVVDVAKGKTAPVPADLTGRVSFDGRETNDRPASWPTIAQRIDPGGAIGATAWLTPADPMPWTSGEVAPVEPIALVGPVEPTPTVKEKGGVNKPLLAAGAGGLVLSGAFYGIGFQARQSYDDPATTDPDDLNALRGRAHGMQTANLISGVLGLGLVGASFVF